MTDSLTLARLLLQHIACDEAGGALLENEIGAAGE
jgi:hypothetical protein